MQSLKSLVTNRKTCAIAVFVLVITVIRVLLAYKTPLYCIADAAYDDELFVEHAKSITLGSWLGNFDFKTLAKIPGFSIYLACFDWLGVPYSVALILTFIVAIVITVLALNSVIENKLFLVLLYVLLLYNPLMFDTQIAQRVYRGGVLVCFSLMTVSSFIGLYANRAGSLKKMLLWCALCCFSLTCFYVLKEDSVWLLPFCLGVIVCFIVSLIKHKKINLQRVLPVAAPFVCVVIAMNLISFANQENYEIRATSDRGDSSFKLVVEDLNMIEDDNYDDNQWLWVSYEALQKAFSASETLATLQDNFNARYENLDYNSLSTVKGDLIDWNLKELVNEAGVYSQGGSAVENFYLQIHEELQAAFNSGELSQKKGLTVSKLTPPLSKAELKYVAKSTVAQLRECFFLHSVTVSNVQATGSNEQQKTFSEITRSPYPKTSDELKSYETEVKSDNAICSAYKLLSKVMFLLAIAGVISFIAMKVLAHKRKQKVFKVHEELTILLIIAGLFLSLIGDVAAVSLYMRWIQEGTCFLLYTGCSAIYVPVIEILCMYLGYCAWNMNKNIKN